MNKKIKEIANLQFQILSEPEGDSVTLEFLDANEEVVMSISMDASKKQQLLIYRSEDDISIPLNEIEKGIEIAKRKVVNINVE